MVTAGTKDVRTSLVCLRNRKEEVRMMWVRESGRQARGSFAREEGFGAAAGGSGAEGGE